MRSLIEFMSLIMRQFYLTIAFILFLFPLFGQQKEKSAKYEKFERNINYTKGYIVLEEERIKGLIKVKSSEVGQFQSVKFVHYSGEKETYYPSDISEFGYYSNKFESIDGSFYKLLAKGKRVDLLQNVSISYGPGVMMGIAGAGAGAATPTISSSKNDTKHLRDVETGELTRVRKIDFRSQTTQLFADCPELIKKIESKEYRFRDLRTIVREYDHCNLSNE